MHLMSLSTATVIVHESTLSCDYISVIIAFYQLLQGLFNSYIGMQGENYIATRKRKLSNYTSRYKQNELNDRISDIHTRLSP
jgi:hypothetical protein